MFPTSPNVAARDTVSPPEDSVHVATHDGIRTPGRRIVLIGVVPT
jgi:hypothetical protein